ncbi:MAG: enoyl-ACP reductase FabI [Vulcanimicrobiota bacterium]
MSLLANKKGLIVGVANANSIAWAIAQEAHKQGAELAFTYLNEALEKRVRPLAEQLGAPHVLPCDVNDDQQIAAVCETLKSSWGKLDFLVHAVAFAQREDLQGRFADTSREGFRTALEVSAYSLVALSRAVAPLMTEGGSIITLTYYGSQKVVQNYNVMGVAKAALEASVRYLANDLGPDNIRVNAVSAGPVKTLSAKGIRGFNDMMSHAAKLAPLQRNVDASEVGKTAVFLLSDLASGVTGETLYIDAGYNIKGM